MCFKECVMSEFIVVLPDIPVVSEISVVLQILWFSLSFDLVAEREHVKLFANCASKLFL